MKKSEWISRSKPVFCAILFILGLTASSYSQTLTIGENQLTIISGQITVENLTSEESTLIVIPVDGSDVANVEMVNATQTIQFFGKKITIEQKTTDFELDGNGKVAWDDNVLIGPVKIVFESATDTLKLIGSRTNPASIHYATRGFKGKAEWFNIIGKKINGNWTPDKLISGPVVEQVTILIKKEPKAKPETAPEPKLTPPKKSKRSNDK